MQFVEVAIPTPRHSTFVYEAPKDDKIVPGMRLIVPFRKKHVIGICIEIKKSPPDNLESSKIKKVEKIIDEPPALTPNLLKLACWMSQYYLAPIGEVCRAVLPTKLFQLDASKSSKAKTPIKSGVLATDKFELTSDQGTVLNSILSTMNNSLPQVHLIHGITGSGKTEIYLRLFEMLASQGKQGLLLVPEIGLTPQLTERVVARFENRVAVYHSGLTDSQRHNQWLKMKNGEVDVTIGTRSALFAPLPNLGAIIVDEEHDSSYKQDDGVSYNGRDSAVMRAHIEGITAVLGSATPSIESISNAKRNKYIYHHLKSRPSGASLPSVQIIDMRNIRKATAHETTEGMKKRREFHSLSPMLYDAISETLDRKEQSLLYVGRRGFAAALQCGACGEVSKCPNCDISLTMHQGKFGKEDTLVCHYCDYHTLKPKICANCGEEVLTPIGHGTERLEAELKDFFPSARVARFDSDTASASVKRHKILDDMRQRKIDILVGTQMITKGHDFPSITLVGVVAADVTLNLPDFRSAEKTFQLLTQVAGRAGRGTSPGQVLIQTHAPYHASFMAAQNHDCDLFAAQEIEYRSKLSYPPFSRLANIKLSSGREEIITKSKDGIAKITEKIHSKFKNGGGIIVLGPAPAPIYKLRNKYRWQMLIKAPTSAVLAKFLSLLRPALENTLPRSVRLSIDVDPVNLM